MKKKEAKGNERENYSQLTANESDGGSMVNVRTESSSMSVAVIVETNVPGGVPAIPRF